jgi:hypothetical protein
MKTALDTELFPNCCEVVEMPLHNQWVYLIQKNGSSGLRNLAQQQNFKLFVNEEISNLYVVDVYIRNPRARYISGVNTYLQHLQRDHPELDYSTAFWFAKRYKFLNTHYLPQFHWLANLSRYMRNDAKIRLRKFTDIGTVTEVDDRARIHPPSSEFVNHLMNNNHGIETWLYLDQILLDLTGQEFTWTELLEYYQKNHKNLLENVLPKT